MADARFEDAGEPPLRLRACDRDDLNVVSMFVQDAVFTRGETSWNPARREFAALLSRFRWESQVEGTRPRQRPERVRSVLRISDILDFSTSDLLDPSAPDVFSCLELRFSPDADLAGKLTLILSGDREIVMEVECIEVSLTDVTSPYPAASKHLPDHS